MRGKCTPYVLSWFVVACILLGGCKPVTPTYIQRIYFIEKSESYPSYEFFEFYENGWFTHCELQVVDYGGHMPVEEAYAWENDCLTLLPSEFFDAMDRLGNYVIIGDQITLNFGYGYKIPSRSGTISDKFFFLNGAPSLPAQKFNVYSPEE